MALKARTVSQTDINARASDQYGTIDSEAQRVRVELEEAKAEIQRLKSEANAVIT